jgi:hypothetical protein
VIVTAYHARYVLRRTGQDVPLDVTYELLEPGQTEVRDTFHDESRYSRFVTRRCHEVNRYVLPDGSEVLATWCPELKIVWWRPLREARDA